MVVRGDDLDEGSDRRQAEAFRQRWPAWQRFGLSAYYAEDDDAVDDLAADLLERFPILHLYTAAALVAAAIEVIPTFRTPHVTLAFADLDGGLLTLRSLAHEARANPYHDR